MKKSLLALASLMAIAGAASAQSSVTIAGVIDASARSVKNGSAGELKTLSTDGMSSSRLIFRGIEDLGGGMRAIFWLEGSVNIDVGGGAKTAATGSVGNAAGGQDWQRRATVALAGNFGEIRLGRDYTPTFWNHTIFDPFGTVGVASSNNIFAYPAAWATGTQVRANNTIGYFLPAMGGLYGQLQVAAGEGTTGNKYMGGRIGYAAGPVNIAAAYGQNDRTGTMPDDTKEMNIAGSFNMGFMTLMAQYNQAENGPGEIKHANIAATFPFGASLLKVAYGQAKYSGITGVAGSPEANQIGLGYQYNLSKRTAIYANFSQVDNDAGLRLTASNTGPSAAAINGFKSTGYEFGINHSF
jgi:predicted porin